MIISTCISWGSASACSLLACVSLTHRRNAQECNVSCRVSLDKIQYCQRMESLSGDVNVLSHVYEPEQAAIAHSAFVCLLLMLGHRRNSAFLLSPIFSTSQPVMRFRFGKVK